MTTTEKLQRIKERCEELLALAEKRTPGKWIPVPLSNSRCDVMKLSGGTLVKIIRGNDGCAAFREAATPDGVFIAACAGSAEAGWRATIALVEHILNGWLTDESGCDIITQNIIAAWEGLV